MAFGGGTEAKIKLFSEYGHVAYQYKVNDACRNMLANILLIDPLPTDPLSILTPLTHGVGSKVIFFLSESRHVAYHINGNGT